MDVQGSDAVDRREIRLALVMNGGVSLAVWMGGVTAEIDRMRRAAYPGPHGARGCRRCRFPAVADAAGAAEHKARGRRGRGRERGRAERRRAGSVDRQSPLAAVAQAALGQDRIGREAGRRHRATREVRPPFDPGRCAFHDQDRGGVRQDPRQPGRPSAGRGRRRGEAAHGAPGRERATAQRQPGDHGDVAARAGADVPPTPRGGRSRRSSTGWCAGSTARWWATTTSPAARPTGS